MVGLQRTASGWSPLSSPQQPSIAGRSPVSSPLRSSWRTSLPPSLLDDARNPSWPLSSFHPWPWRASRRCSRHCPPISSPRVVKEGGQANCQGERSCCRYRCRCRRRRRFMGIPTSSGHDDFLLTARSLSEELTTVALGYFSDHTAALIDDFTNGIILLHSLGRQDDHRDYSLL